MKGIVNTGIRGPGPAVGQGVIYHAVHQASLTALGLQHPPESVWSDELVPLVRAPDKELIIILVSELDRGSIRSSPRYG